METKKFRSLPPRERALVALAVLLDGREAATYLALDSESGQALERSSLEVAALEPELRMPFLGTAFRAALVEAGGA